MQTLVLIPIFLILASSFLPLSRQQAGLVIPPDRPVQQLRQQVRRNPNLKLIFNSQCGNSGWFTVTRNQCPIAFIDPTFNNHQAICNNAGNWVRSYRGQVGQMFVYNRGNRGVRFCAHVFPCSCPALARCPNIPIFTNPPIFTISPPINPIDPILPSSCVCHDPPRFRLGARRRGERERIGGWRINNRGEVRCNSRDDSDPQQRFFCYVDPFINRARGCRDISRSRVRDGWFYSYNACPRNNFPFLRGGREDEDEKFERSGEFTDDASEQEDVGTDDVEFVKEIHDDANEDIDVNSNVEFAP